MMMDNHGINPQAATKLGFCSLCRLNRRRREEGAGARKGKK